MKLLVVEDEQKTRAYLQRGLTEAGFVVDVESSGDNGLHLALTGQYDLVILDVMLPGVDGWSILSQMRAAGKSTLVLLLSARGSTEDRIRGLELGADVYFTKPFSFTELIAQIRSLIRRAGTPSQDMLEIDDLSIDALACRATRCGKRLDLTPKEFQLLTLLARRQGEVLSRAVIAEQVWDISFDSDTNVVDVHINRLRSKVEAEDKRKLIHTVRGMGYVLRPEE